MLEKNSSKCFLFKKDHVLFKDGDTISGKSVFLIKEGKAELRYKFKHNKEISFIIPSGGFLGIFENFAEQQVRITSVRFIEDSKVYSWEKEDFLSSVTIIPELGIKSVTFLSSFLRTLNQKMKELG